jgi:hypothetical protein
LAISKQIPQNMATLGHFFQKKLLVYDFLPLPFIYLFIYFAKVAKIHHQKKH